MIGDLGPYIDPNGPLVWVPRSVPYRKAWGVAREAVQGYGQVLRYRGQEKASLLGFVRDCPCEEVCERRWYNDLDTGDRSCEVLAWRFEIVECGQP